MQVLRRVGFAALLAMPLALLASAAASIIIAVLAVPIALLATHDGYLALLSVSYGPFAAAMTLQAVLVATLAWGIIEPLRVPQPRYHLVSLLIGATASSVGLFGGALPLFAALHVPWRYGPALSFTAISAVVAVILGAAAAGVHALIIARHPIQDVKLTGWRADMQQMTWRILAFAVPLAVLFAGWAAILGALGRI